MIYKGKNRAIAIIVTVILAMGASQAFGANSNDPNNQDANDPNLYSVIAVNTEHLVFGVKTTSQTFEIWNQGIGILSYQLSFDEEGAKYFTVDPNGGKSHDVNDIKTHTVTVDYNAIPHGETVHGKIEINNLSDDNDTTVIDLYATESIGTHIFQIKILKGIDYGILKYNNPFTENGWDTSCDGLGLNGDFDCDGDVDFVDFSAFAEQWGQDGKNIRADISPECGNEVVNYEDLVAFCDNWLKNSQSSFIYKFSLSVATDNTITDMEFQAPDGETYVISDREETEPSSFIWTYEDSFDSADGLSVYEDGEYVITFLYEDGGEAATLVKFSIPNKPGTIPQPVQKPVLVNPLPGSVTVNPVQLRWEKCSDPAADKIRLNCRARCSDAVREWEFGKSTSKTGVLNLDIGKWLAEISFGRWYQMSNDDGIYVEAGKFTRSHANFDITKLFGTFGKEKNRPLKLMNCDGAEVTFNVTGGGWGRIEGGCSFENIILEDTTEKSVFKITPQKGSWTNIGNITVQGPIKSIMGKYVNLHGNIQIDGSAKNIVLEHVVYGDPARPPTLIAIGEPASPKTTCTLNLGLVDNLDLKSETPIKTLRATNWLSGSLKSPWISSLTVKGDLVNGISGDFGADVTVGGDENLKGIALKNASIAGQLTGQWEIAGNCSAIKTNNIKEWDLTVEPEINDDEKSIRAIRNIKSKNWIKDSSIVIDTSADIGTITTGAIQNCTISTEGSLKLFKMKSLLVPYCFINSNIEAKYIGSVTLLYTKYNNIIDGEHTPFGLTATSIGKLTIKDMYGKKTWKKLIPGETIEGIPIGDFEVNPPSE